MQIFRNDSWPRSEMRRFLALGLSGVALSCTVQKVARDADAFCKVSAKVACEQTVSAGVAICSPATPATTGVMVCESAANGVSQDELSVDPISLVQNGTATQTISAPIVMPDGEIAAVAACAINKRHESVVYAMVTRGPQTKAQSEYLRNRGDCLD